jgi:nitric oxide dioxygenase
MAGMLSHLVEAGSHLPITLLHADLDENSFALRRQVLDDIQARTARSPSRRTRA